MYSHFVYSYVYTPYELYLLYQKKRRAATNQNPALNNLVMYKDKTTQYCAGVKFPTLSSGNYTATGNNYFQHIDSGQLIKLCERKKETNKPPLYLMARNDSSGKMEFFSSLYGTGTTYTAESSRVYYTITLMGDTLSVVRKGGNAYV